MSAASVRAEAVSEASAVLAGVDLTERFGRLLDQSLIPSALPAD
jgi:hypothetical protein